MKKDADVFLMHIIDSIESINRYIEGKSEEEFLGSPETQDAVIRRLAIIGEAAKNLPLGIREKHAGVKWKAIIGMKNVLVHEYFGIDMKVVWHIVKNDMPNLRSEIVKMLKE